MEGLILRSLGGFYTVIGEDGTRTECRGRGIFRKDATTLLVGDRCSFCLLYTSELPTNSRM